MTARYFKLGLIGYPLGHSLSPVIHLAALNAMNVAGEYRLYSLQLGAGDPAPLLHVLNQVRTGALDGLNVTIPYKHMVDSYIDIKTSVVQCVGSVNTIYKDKGRLVGDNTDVSGFLVDLLDQFGDEWFAHRPITALVLGAGGAARAVVYALWQAGWRVIVAARRIEQAKALITSLKENLHSPLANSDHPTALDGLMPVSLDLAALRSLTEIKLVVNATPVGMNPQCAANPWPESISLPVNSVVYDLVYNPLETALVRTARHQGLNAATGLGMLVEQAALSFERWTGLRPPRAVMVGAAMNALTNGSMQRDQGE